MRILHSQKSLHEVSFDSVLFKRFLLTVMSIMVFYVTFHVLCHFMFFFVFCQNLVSTVHVYLFLFTSLFLK